MNPSNAFKGTLLACCLAFLLVSLAQGSNTQALVFGYEPGIDQRVVRVVASDPVGPAPVFITKKFLENRKFAVDPERAKQVVYEIRDLDGGKAVPLQTYRKADAPRVVDISSTDNGYVAAVVRAGSDLDLFRYLPGGKIVERIDLPGKLDQGMRIERVYKLQLGYAIVGSTGAQPSIEIYDHDGGEPVSLDLAGDAGRVVSIGGVTEKGRNLYVLLTSVEDQGAGVLSVWLYRFDSLLSKASRLENRLVRANVDSLAASFIASTHKHPSAQIVIRKSVQQPPVVKLMALGRTPKLVKQFDLETLEAEPSLAFAGICSDAYIIAKKLFTKNLISNEIEFRTIDSSGQVKRTRTTPMVTNGSLIDITLATSANGLFSFVNFSKLEDVRRKDGWYSWLGYRVDRIDIARDCD